MSFLCLHKCSAGIKKLRLYSIKLDTLTAIKEVIPDAQVIVQIPNHLVGEAASNYDTALAMVKPLADYTSIVSHIAVSNDPESTFTVDELSTILLPALNNVRGALVQLGLPIKPTVPFSTSILGTEFPPSAASLKGDLLPQLKSLLQVR